MIDYSTMVYSLPHVPSGVNGVKVSKHGIGQVVSSADHIVTPATLAWLEARRGKGWQVLSTTPPLKPLFLKQHTQHRFTRRQFTHTRMIARTLTGRALHHHAGGHFQVGSKPPVTV